MNTEFPVDSHFGDIEPFDWKSLPPPEEDNDDNDDEWAPGYKERHSANGVNWTEKDFEDFKKGRL